MAIIVVVRPIKADALVSDIGGTTTDVALLQATFARLR